MPLAAGDLAQIHDLYARYNHAVDAGEGERFADCFTADASVDIGAGPVVGRDALVKVPAWVARNLPGVRHFASNVIVDGDGDGDRATGSAYLLLYVVEKGAPPVLRSSGRYSDTLRRTPDGWRFEQRFFASDT